MTPTGSEQNPTGGIDKSQRNTNQQSDRQRTYKETKDTPGLNTLGRCRRKESITLTPGSEVNPGRRHEKVEKRTLNLSMNDSN